MLCVCDVILFISVSNFTPDTPPLLGSRVVNPGAFTIILYMVMAVATSHRLGLPFRTLFSVDFGSKVVARQGEVRFVAQQGVLK
jgi:hypothetical protein